MEGITITRFEARKVEEEWFSVGFLGLRQIGAVPADDAAAAMPTTS